MGDLRVFYVYELVENGEIKERVFPESDLEQYLNSEKVLFLIRKDIRRLFIWKGAKSPVKKRFISTRIAQDIQQDLMKNPQYHRCKIVSVDQGDEIQEFLDIFNLESMEVEERLIEMKYIRNSEIKKSKKEKKYPKEREYRINEHLTLKLVRGETVIFIDDKPFHQCKYLLLNLSQKDFTKFDNIDSIDEAFEVYSTMEKSHEKEKDLIDPETEFIGHCSNLEAWYEYDYDLRILHSSLSIPLLKKMAFLGDKKAIIKLKESIAARIASGNYNTIIFYLNEKYLELFTNEELEVIFEEWLERNTDFSPMEKRRLWYPLLKELIERDISKARWIIKEEITSCLDAENYETFRYLLTNDFLQLLNLEELEEIYDLIPQQDKVALKKIENLILKATLEKRRISKE
ncbi:MAG: hypothetical protein BAJALOKI1v1_840004 [Promethearchaeota archaeon]|nr:MAG: hypothetical protein BAJALOKI1v1_840004 [Candidatus Lokiarchaeota archaeon]